MVGDAVRRKVSDYVAALAALGVPVSRVVLFGSWARGEANEWSDIDVIVISPIFDAPNSRAAAALLWKALTSVGGYLEPVPCGERRWIEDDESPVIEIARREGVEVYRAA